MTDESAIKKSICEYLETLGARCLFTVTPPKRTKYCSKFMKAGWPDIYGICRQDNTIHPCPFFIEVKTSTGTLSLEQHKVLEQAKTIGAIAIVATCVEDVRRVIR